MNGGFIFQALRLVAVVALLAGCTRPPGELFDAMMSTDDNEQFRLLSGEAVDLGKDSIPIFLAILNRDVGPDRKLSVLEIGKDDVCLANLNELAKRGIFSIHEVPVLLREMEEEPLILKATLISAETLKLITGLDVGYSEQFVAKYNKADESKRQEMLAAWRNWYEQNKGLGAE